MLFDVDVLWNCLCSLEGYWSLVVSARVASTVKGAPISNFVCLSLLISILSHTEMPVDHSAQKVFFNTITSAFADIPAMDITS